MDGGCAWLSIRYARYFAIKQAQMGLKLVSIEITTIQDIQLGLAKILSHETFWLYGISAIKVPPKSMRAEVQEWRPKTTSKTSVSHKVSNHVL